MRLLTIRKRPDFVLNSKKGVAFHSKTIMVLASKTPQKYLSHPVIGKIDNDFCRVGYTTTKKIGGAVVRNKIKRRLREIMRELIIEYGLSQHDYVLIAKKEAAGADFKALRSDVKFCLRNLRKKVEESR